MIGTINCIYETPCGWCTKWDKKCDKKISYKKDKDLENIKAGKGISMKGQHTKTGILDDNNFKPCNDCENNGWDMPECKECNIGNGFKYFKGVK